MSVLRRLVSSWVVVGVVAGVCGISLSARASMPEGFTAGVVDAQAEEDRSLLDVVLGFETELEPDLFAARARTEESREARAPASADVLSIEEQGAIWESAPTVLE